MKSNNIKLKLFIPKFSWVTSKNFDRYSNSLPLLIFISYIVFFIFDSNTAKAIFIITLTLLIFDILVKLFFKGNIYQLFFTRIGFVVFDKNTINLVSNNIMYNTNVENTELGTLELVIIYIDYYHEVKGLKYVAQYLGIHNQIYFTKKGFRYCYHFLIENEESANVFLNIITHWKEKNVNFTFKNFKNKD